MLDFSRSFLPRFREGLASCRSNFPSISPLLGPKIVEIFAKCWWGLQSKMATNHALVASSLDCIIRGIGSVNLLCILASDAHVFRSLRLRLEACI